MSFFDDFDPDNEPEIGALPKGKYRVIIEEAKIRPTKKQDGQLLELTFVVVEGQHAKRKIWKTYNIENPSEAAVDIARKQLASLSRAIGIKPKHESDFIEGILVISVTEGEYEGKPTNDVTGYYPSTSVAVAATTSTTSPSTVQPWKK